jgi:hypothetical protein
LRAAILKVENEGKTHLPTIKSYLKEKYKLEAAIDTKDLIIAQRNHLINKVQNRTSHQKFMRHMKTK